MKEQESSLTPEITKVQEYFRLAEEMRKSSISEYADQWYLSVVCTEALIAFLQGDYAASALKSEKTADWEYILRARNTVFSSNIPTNHAEKNIIEISEFLGRDDLSLQEKDLLEEYLLLDRPRNLAAERRAQVLSLGRTVSNVSGSTIISLAEPCSMYCVDAILGCNRKYQDNFMWGGISRVIYGVYDGRAGGLSHPEARNLAEEEWQQQLHDIDIVGPNQLRYYIPEKYMLLMKNIYSLCDSIMKKSQEERLTIAKKSHENRIRNLKSFPRRILAYR